MKGKKSSTSKALDEKIAALRSEARKGYSKDEVRRNIILAELKERSALTNGHSHVALNALAANPLKRSGEKLLELEKAIQSEQRQAVCLPSPLDSTPSSSPLGASSPISPALRDAEVDQGGGCLKAAWTAGAWTVGAAPTEESEGDTVVQNILAQIESFQTSTLPLLNDTAAEFVDDTVDKLQERRVLERDDETGLPTALHPLGLSCEEFFFGEEASFNLPGSLPSSPSPCPITGSRSRARDSCSALASPIERPRGAQLPPHTAGPPHHPMSAQQSRLIVQRSGADGLVRKLRQNRHSQPLSSELEEREAPHRPSTAYVVRVVRPAVLAKCPACEALVECDAAALPSEGKAAVRASKDFTCVHCRSTLDQGAVLEAYRSQLFPTSDVVDCEMPLQASAVKKAHEVKTLCDVKMDAEVGQGTATTAEGIAVGTENEGETEEHNLCAGTSPLKEKTLPYPVNLSEAVKGLYFGYLWSQWEESEAMEGA